MAPLKKINVKKIQPTAPAGKHVLLKFCLSTIAALAILAGILWGLPAIARAAEEKRRAAIDKNATIVQAVIVGKNSHKGRSVAYRYNYAGKAYKNFQQGFNLFDNVAYGTTVEIKLDTLNPDESYIIGYD